MREENNQETKKAWDSFDSYPIPIIAKNSRSLKIPPFETDDLITFKEEKRVFGNNDVYFTHYPDFKKIPKSEISPTINYLKQSANVINISVNFQEKKIYFEISDVVKNMIIQQIDETKLPKHPPLLFSSRKRSDIKDELFIPNYFLQELQTAKKKNNEFNPLVFAFIEEKEKDFKCFTDYFNKHKEFCDKHLIKIYFQEKDLGIGRKRKLMMILMEYFKLPL